MAKFKLTPNEEKLLKSMNMNPTIKQAAGASGLSVSQAYNLLFRLRNKRRDAQKYINILNNYCRQSRLTNRSLAYKVVIHDNGLLEIEE